MLSKLLFAPILAMLAILAGSGPGPTLDSQDPIVWSQLCDDGVVAALHSDGTFTASKLTEEGVVVTSTTAPPQGQVTPTTPVISTSYTGVDHATHTITTPVASTTPAGLAAAMTTHRTLVALMKVQFPPQP